jgi:hypothetical protein
MNHVSLIFDKIGELTPFSILPVGAARSAVCVGLPLAIKGLLGDRHGVLAGQGRMGPAGFLEFQKAARSGIIMVVSSLCQ